MHSYDVYAKSRGPARKIYIYIHNNVICSEGMLTHLFFPVREFGLGSGQIQMLVVSSSLRTGWLVPHLKNRKLKKRIKKEKKKRNKKKSILLSR